MPSAEHESPVALAKLEPDLVAWLLANLFEVKVPDYHHARNQDTDVQVLVPRTCHADSMVLFCDPANQPLAAAVLEVQRSRDPAKRRTWKLYVAQLESELDVSAALVVFCPDPTVARWYRQLLEPDDLSGLPLRPLIFTPEQVPLVAELDRARANPALAVLSAICHGGHDQLDAMFPALADQPSPATATDRHSAPPASPADLAAAAAAYGRRSSNAAAATASRTSAPPAGAAPRSPAPAAGDCGRVTASAPVGCYAAAANRAQNAPTATVDMSGGWW